MKFCPILWIDEIFIHKALESLEWFGIKLRGREAQIGEQIFDLFLDKDIKILIFINGTHLRHSISISI